MTDVLAWHRALAAAGLDVVRLDTTPAVGGTVWISITARGAHGECRLAVDMRDPKRFSTYVVYDDGVVPIPRARTVSGVIAELVLRLQAPRAVPG